MCVCVFFNGLFTRHDIVEVQQSLNRMRKFTACITCFAGILDSRLGLCSASEPVESGRGADVEKPLFQMLVEFEFL